MKDMTLRQLIAALTCLFTLAACGQSGAPAANSSTAAPQGEQAGSVILGSTQNLPDWLLVARQRDCDAGERCPLGEVLFNQRTITRNADGTADIWIMVRHGAPQLYGLEDERTQTTIHYTVERLHYRFNCQTAQFIVVERQIMGANDTVVAHDNPRPIYRAPVQGSATGVIEPIACRGG
jgi:hypothetical protein